MKPYKQADFVEVGRTYYIPDESSSYNKAFVVKILHDFAVINSKGEVFTVPFSNLYLPTQTD